MFSLKYTKKFPPMLQICIGYEYRTAKDSEWLDGLLFSVAKRPISYIWDILMLCQKFAAFLVSSSCQVLFLVTMNVSSFCDNIDHEEGVEPCMDAFEKQSNKIIPSNIPSRLSRRRQKNYYHMKGRTTCNFMAVNFADVFPTKFEKQLMETFKFLHARGPIFRLPFIDDVFFSEKDHSIV